MTKTEIKERDLRSEHNLNSSLQPHTRTHTHTHSLTQSHTHRSLSLSLSLPSLFSLSLLIHLFHIRSVRSLSHSLSISAFLLSLLSLYSLSISVKISSIENLFQANQGQIRAAPPTPPL